MLDEATIDIVKALGGLKAIAISHPHYYATNAQWSSIFGNVPVYIHEKYGRPQTPNLWSKSHDLK